MEAETLKAKRMFVLDQLKEERDPVKRALILLDCPYYYFVAHKLDIRDNLQGFSAPIEQNYFTALTNYLIAEGKRREESWEALINKRAALKAVADGGGRIDEK